MRLLSNPQVADWCRLHQIEIGKEAGFLSSGFQGARFGIPQSASKYFWLSRFVATSLRPWRRSLLWVTTWGVWPSSENWHLYYRLRQSYKDYRLLDDAPGHLFLDYEESDLITFLQVSLESGWDLNIFTFEDYVRVRISHDEWMEFYTKDETKLKETTSVMTEAGYPLKPTPPAPAEN